MPEDVWSSRIDKLQNKGAKVIAIDEENGMNHQLLQSSTSFHVGLLSIPSLLIRLNELGIKSLMVEGGARVIASFFAHPEVINTIIVTVAPKFVGTEGIGYGVASSQVNLLCSVFLLLLIRRRSHASLIILVILLALIPCSVWYPRLCNNLIFTLQSSY